MNDAGIVYDVALVGFGPCGQVLAAELGRRGHRVVAIERSPEPYPLPRAGHVDDEIIRVFQGIGAAEEFVDRAVTPRGYEWVDAAERPLFTIDWNRPTASTWRSDYIFYQPYLEEALTAAALRNPSVTLHQGWEVTGIDDDADALTIHARQGHRESGRWEPTGAEHVLRARYLVGVDGANSFVRRWAGIEREDLGFEETLSIVDLRLHDLDADIAMPDAGQICDPERPISLFRWLGREHCRWEFMLMPGEDPQELVSEQKSWSMLARWGITPETATMIRRTLYTFRSMVADTFRSGRVLLAGDAAHVMPPFLGQGMCSGIRDVTNLAWKLDLVLRGASSEDLLDSYTAERRPHITDLTGIAIALGKVLCETDPVAAAARDEALRSGLVPPTPPIPGLADGVLLHHSDGGLAPMAGLRSVQGEVTRRDVTGRLDDLVRPGWLLLTRHGGLAESLGEQARLCADRMGLQIIHLTKAQLDPAADAVIDRDGIYSAQFREAEADLILVRPDHHIFGVSGRDDADRLVTDAARQLCLTES